MVLFYFSGFSFRQFVQERLGHKNIKETIDIYNHWSDKQEEIHSAVLEGMFTAKKKDDTSKCVIPEIL